MKVFISYAREDSEIAQRFYRHMQKPGIEPWLDTSDIEPGAKWSQMIEQEINESEYFLALISERALSKSYVQYEWHLALSKNKSFIPIRLELCSLPKKLSELQWVDLFPAEEDGLRKILRRLNRAKTKANFEETFSSLGTDNDGWDLSEWGLSKVDHTGEGSGSIYGEAAHRNTITKTTFITLNVGDSTMLQFYRRLKLNTANFMAEASFRAIIDDGSEHVIDKEVIYKKVGSLEEEWKSRTIDLSAYYRKNIVLKFLVTATDPLSLTSYAKAWIDDIVMFGPRQRK